MNGPLRQLHNHVEIGVTNSGSTYVLISSQLLFVSRPCLFDGFVLDRSWLLSVSMNYFLYNQKSIVGALRS